MAKKIQAANELYTVLKILKRLETFVFSSVVLQ